MKKVTLAKLKGSFSLLTPPHLLSSPLPLSAASLPFPKNKECVWSGGWMGLCCRITHHPHFKRSPHYQALDVSNNPDTLLHTNSPRPAPSAATGCRETFQFVRPCFEKRDGRELRGCKEMKWLSAASGIWYVQKQPCPTERATEVSISTFVKVPYFGF